MQPIDNSAQPSVLTAKKSAVALSDRPPSPNPADPGQSYKSALSVLAMLFFMWGFLTALNDILVPHLKSLFDLSYAQVMLIQFSFFSAYFVFAMPSGKVLEHFGYKKTMIAGLAIMGLGAFLFIPAATIPAFPLFLAALVVLAAGITVLQVAANPYVAALGPPATASSRLNLTQGFNSLGTTIAPLLGSVLILSSTPKSTSEIRALAPAALRIYRVHQASSVKLPYLALGLALLALAVVIALFKFPTMPEERTMESGAPKASIWKQRHLILGAVAIFLYVGAEVSIGSFLVSYIVQPDIGNLSVQIAARFVALYWGGAMVGRFIGSGLLRKIRTGSLLGIAALIAAVLVLVSMIAFGHVAMASLLAVGLFNSIMFPSIFTLGIEGLGPLTGEGSGLLVCAIVGGAIVPELQGILADRIGIHHAFVLPVIAYLYIAYFAFWGSRPSDSDASHQIPAKA